MECCYVFNRISLRAGTHKGFTLFSCNEMQRLTQFPNVGCTHVGSNTESDSVVICPPATPKSILVNGMQATWRIRITFLKFPSTWQCTILEESEELMFQHICKITSLCKFSSQEEALVFARCLLGTACQTSHDSLRLSVEVIASLPGRLIDCCAGFLLLPFRSLLWASPPSSEGSHGQPPPHLPTKRLCPRRLLRVHPAFFPSACLAVALHLSARRLSQAWVRVKQLRTNGANEVGGPYSSDGDQWLDSVKPVSV